MLDLKDFMKKTGVTKKCYVDEWLDDGLIPGAVRNKETNAYSFPDSARRPYKCGGLKPGASAEKIRAHIVKAALLRHYVSPQTCYMSEGEFAVMVADLERAGLIVTRTEDGIEYIDSTTKSEAYKKKSIEPLTRFIQECLKSLAEGAAKGAVGKALKS